MHLFKLYIFFNFSSFLLLFIFSVIVSYNYDNYINKTNILIIIKLLNKN